jgi:hypothetical protein
MPDFNNIRFQSSRPLLQEVTAERLNAILQEIRRTKPLPGRGITTRQEGGGVRIDLAATLRGGGGGAATPIQPWDLLAQPDPDSTAENPPYKIKVQPGTLNGILPSNWDEEFDAQPTGVYYAKAKITTDGEAVTGVSIEIDTTPPSVQEPVEFGLQTDIEYLFGLFSQGSVWRVIGAGHIRLAPRAWLAEDVPNPAPGVSPYTIYYYLGPS